MSKEVKDGNDENNEDVTFLDTLRQNAQSFINQEKKEEDIDILDFGKEVK